MQSTIVRTELLLASLLPTAAILLVGVVGVEQMSGMDIRFFLVVLFASASAVFCAEYSLIRFMRRTTEKQLNELVLACQEYLSGNSQRRPDIYEDNVLSPLAYLLHALLNAITQPIQQDVQPSSTQENVPPDIEKKLVVLQQLDIQLQKLIREVIPVTKGDLRVRADIPQGNVGVIADLFNAFIEEVIYLVQWLRYSAVQITGGISTFVNCSTDLAQTAETQLLHFSETTKTIETLAAELETFHNALQRNRKTVRKIQTYVNQYASDGPPEKNDLLQRLKTEARLQEQLLEEGLNSAQSNIILAKSLVSDFHTFAKHIYESSTGALQATEGIQAVARLAEQWYAEISAFHLPTEVEDKVSQPASTPIAAKNITPIAVVSTQKNSML